MAFVTTQKNNPKFQNYMCAVLALRKAGESLGPFTENKIQEVHETIIKQLEHLPLSECTNNCSEQKPSVKDWCTTCTEWKKQLEKYYKRKMKVIWADFHSWLWPKDAYNIFEVFANTIQPNHQDISNIFCVWSNCSEFDDQLKITSQILRDKRNSLFHNECEITTDDLKEIVNAIRQLLGEQDIKDKMDNHAEVMHILDELEKGNILFDSLFNRSFEELINNQHKSNQERINNLSERYQSLMTKHGHMIKEVQDNLKETTENHQEQIHNLKETTENHQERIQDIEDRFKLFSEIKQKVFSVLKNTSVILIVLLPSMLGFGLSYMLQYDSSLGIQRYGCLDEHPKMAVLQANYSMEGYLTPYSELHGRTWPFQEVERQLLRLDTKKHGLVLIADMGYGKTTFMKHVICAEEHTPGAMLREHVAIYHVCRFQSRMTRNVGLFILRTTSMLSIHLRKFSKFIDTDKTCTNNYGSIDKCEADMFGCFDQCVLFPLRDEQHGLHSPLLIVIDAIDECVEETTETNNILNLLNRRIHYLPSWIQFMISSRNISHIYSLEQFLRIQTLSSNDSRNIQDINLYLKYHNVYDTKVNESTWNFQIQKFLLEQSDDTILSTSSSPEVSLYRYYELNFDRLFNNNYEIGKYILNIICASDEPLGESTLIDIVSKINVNVSEAAIQKNVLKLRHLISIFNGKIQLIHNSLKHWLVEKDSPYRIDLRKGHQDIAAYFIEHLPSTGYDTADLLIHISQAVYPPVLVKGFRNLNTTEFIISESFQDVSIYQRLALKTNDGRTVDLAHHHVKSFDFKSKHGVPASYTAAMHGNDKVLDALIKLGFDINFRVKFHNMIAMADAISMIESHHWKYGLLDIAAQYGRTRVVKYLLQNDSYQFDKRNGAHLLPIHLACKYGYLEIVSMIHTKFPRMLDRICLYYSAHHGFRDIVQYCLDYDIIDEGMPCNSSLYWLSRNQVRIQGEKSPLFSSVVLYDDWHYINCETALHAAVERNHSDIVQMLLLRAPLTIRCFDRSGKTPFMYAIIHDYRHIGSLMMDNKYFNPNVTCKPFMTYENSSQLSGHELNKLKTNRCPEDTSLIHLSAQFDRNWFLERIFSKMGYYSEERDEYGCHPLHYAACRGSLFILRHFVNLNSTAITGLSCSNGSLLIHSAAICGSVESVKFLRNYFRTNVVDKAGRTTIMYTVLRYVGHDTAYNAEYDLRDTLTIVDELHINESNLKVHDEYQRNILHYAIANGHFSILSVMMDRYLELVRVLLRKKDVLGLSPISYAIAHMTRNNTFRLNVTNDLLEPNCKEHRQKYLMTPVEYSMFLLFLRHSQGLFNIKLNTRRVLGIFIEKNSFHLFAATLKCIRNDLTSDDEERVLNKLVKHDASGFMMQVYVSMRYLRYVRYVAYKQKSALREQANTGHNDLSKCATKMEFSIIHFLALHIDPIVYVYYSGRIIYNPLLMEFITVVNATELNTCYDSDGYNVLERAIQGGNVRFVRYLLDNGFTSSRDTCELLHMTVTPYKFKNARTLLYVIRYIPHDGLEVRTFNKSENDLFIEFNKFLPLVSISPIYYSGLISDRMLFDEMGTYLLDTFHDTLSGRCICSNDSLQLSFVHYLAIGGYKLSTDTAVKYFGTSILMCSNRHWLTPLYLGKLFNSSEIIDYLKPQNIKLKLPMLEAEQNILITMQPKHDSIKTLYRKCFPFRLGSVFISGQFRRVKIMIRCVRKLSKVLGLNNEIVMSELSKLKARTIMVNSYQIMKILDVNNPLAQLIRHANKQKDSKLLKQTRFSYHFIEMFEQLTCSVLKHAYIRKIKLELPYRTVARLHGFMDLQDSDMKRIEKMTCGMIRLELFLHKYSLETKYLRTDTLPHILLWAQIKPTDFPYKFRFYVDRLNTVFCARCRLISSFLPHNVFSDIRYTYSYQNYFMPRYASIESINNALLKFTGVPLMILKESKFNLGNFFDSLFKDGE